MKEITSRDRLYRIYHGIKTRCYNKKRNRWNVYGGKGILMCDEWLNNPKSFYEWAFATGYKNNLTIDRINPNGNYEPNNCRWSTYKEQANNKTNNRILEYHGEKHTMREWAEILNINYQTLSTRLNRDKRNFYEIADEAIEYVRGFIDD